MRIDTALEWFVIFVGIVLAVGTIWLVVFKLAGEYLSDLILHPDMVAYNKSTYKRNDKIWPWGYYISWKMGLQKGQYGSFVAQTKEEAVRQVHRKR